MQEKEVPFLIRGHHLDWFRDALLDGPGQTAKRIVDGIRKDANSLDSDQLWYMRDTIGEIGSGAGDIRFRRVFEDFISLEDTHPVYFVARQPDNICGACIIGEHCRRKSQGISDRRYVEAFLGTAAGMGLAVTLEQTTVSFSDSPELVSVPVVKTDAKIARAVLKGMGKNNQRSY